MYAHNLESFSDERGALYPLEFKRLPFTPQRMFIVADVPKGGLRGGHAHYKTEQFLICLKGEIEVILYDGQKETIILLSPMKGVYVPEMSWDSQVFKTGSDILLALASTEYDETDYITDKNKFRNIVNG